jgi:hypothetical protein
LNRSKCQIDDVVDTTRCHGGDDFSKIVVAFKRVRSNCGAKYRREARRAQVASERDGTTCGIDIGNYGVREKSARVQPAAQ